VDEGVRDLVAKVYQKGELTAQHPPRGLHDHLFRAPACGTLCPSLWQTVPQPVADCAPACGLLRSKEGGS